LDSQTQSDREGAEKRLHELTHGIFEKVIPSVVDANDNPDVVSVATRGLARLGNQTNDQLDWGPATPFGPDIIKQAISDWTRAWTQANDQVDQDPSTPFGLFAKLAIVDKKDFLESVESLQVKSLSTLDQIAVARSIQYYQRGTGRATERSRTLLLNYLRELNKQSTAEFDEERFLKHATLATCQRRLTTVLKNRRLRASRLYGKTKNARLLKEVQIEFAKELIALYPETKVAKQAAEKLNLPVSVRNETK
jgi:hypothetical protein